MNRELRIGSYVHPVECDHVQEEVQDHIFLKVSVIEATGTIIVKGSPEIITPEYYAAVTLTDKLLHRIGFTKVDFSGAPNVTGTLWRKLLDNCIVDIYPDKTILNLSTRIAHICHLHQWQNLYKVLTGEELKLDL